jgi:hypothetical protein
MSYYLAYSFQSQPLVNKYQSLFLTRYKLNFVIN